MSRLYLGAGGEMAAFGSGMSSAPSGVDALRDAVAQARVGLGSSTPVLAILFASVSYADANEIPALARELLPNVPIVGGTSGHGLVGPIDFSFLGVSIVLLGSERGAPHDDLEVSAEEAPIASAELLDTVTAGARIAAAADAAALRGFAHFTCLVFAPGVFVDGEALVAAVRKGAGARAQLAGALLGDDLTMDRPKVMTRAGFSSEHVVLVGLFSKSLVGIAAGHGYRAMGPIRTVTKSEERRVVSIDGRPALDVWLDDARAAGSEPPTDLKELSSYLGAHYGLGIAGIHDPARAELVMRAPTSVGPDGIELAAGIPEGTQVRVLRGRQADLMRAAADVASTAADRAGRRPVGALVLVCTGRQIALGAALPAEIDMIRQRIKAPIGGSCVYGEIARNVRDSDAFFTTTVVVVAFGASSR